MPGELGGLNNCEVLETCRLSSTISLGLTISFRDGRARTVKH